MGKVQEAQEKVKQAQAELGNISANGESGAGLVKATINGQRQITNLDIDSSLLKEEDKEMLQDLIIAAINKAGEEIEPKVKEHMQKATAGMLPNIPGLDLNL